jgi:hypothetical protein
MQLMPDISMLQYGDGFRVCPTLPHHRKQERRATIKLLPDLHLGDFRYALTTAPKFAAAVLTFSPL